MMDDKGGNYGSSAIGTSSSSSTNRKRKNSEQPADDDGVLPVATYIRSLFDITRILDDYPWFFTRVREPFMNVYSIPLRKIVNTIQKYDSIREKICEKIWGEFFDFKNNKNVSEQAALYYSLLAYPNFLEWLNEMKTTVTDCRGKAIKHMLELLNKNSSIVIQDDDNHRGFPWRKKLIPKREPRVYHSTQNLLFALRPYSSFLKWLQPEEEEEKEEDKWLNYNGPQKSRARFIERLLNYFSDPRIEDDVRVQQVLHGVQIHVNLLKGEHEKEVPAEKKQEPPKKEQTVTGNPYTLNPILDGLSEEDRKLLTGFHRKYQDIPLLVLPEYRKYHNQLMNSKGFDFDTYPGSFNNMSPIMPIGLFPSDFKNIDLNKLAEYAANEKYGENKIKIEKVVRVNMSRSLYARFYYLTFLGLYDKSPYHFKALVKGSLKGNTSTEAFEVVSFSPESIELDKRVTRSAAKSKAHILESELKVDKQPKATRRSSRSITQGSESKGTKEKVSEGEYSNHNCEKHRKDLSLINSFLDMPDDELLKNIRGPAKAPPIKELRKYLEEVSESEGFHIGKYPGFFPIVTSIIRPVDWDLWGLSFIPIRNLAKLAIESYNDENRSGFGFDRITEVNVSERMHYHFYTSFLAHDGDAAAETFQALVSVNMRLLRDYQVHFCRIAIATK